MLQNILVTSKHVVKYNTQATRETVNIYYLKDWLTVSSPICVSYMTTDKKQNLTTEKYRNWFKTCSNVKFGVGN